VAVASVGAGAAINNRTPAAQHEPAHAPLTQTPALGVFGQRPHAAVEASRQAGGHASAHLRPPLLERPAMSALQPWSGGAGTPAASAGAPPAAPAPAGAPEQGKSAGRDLDPAARIPAVLGARSAAVDGEAPAGAITRVLETVGEISRGTHAAAESHAAAAAAAAADRRRDVARAVAAALLAHVAAAVTEAASVAQQAVTRTVQPAAHDVPAAAAADVPAVTAVSDSVSSTVSDTTTTTTTTPALTSLGG
jgi:hypothetical protein